MSPHLHIVAFDIPYPANYGGAIDIFYKVKALKEAGVNVHLHSFLYHREPAAELDELCASVHYYNRHVNKTLLLHKLPYIVISRRNDELKRNLLKDDHPILLEGLHTTSLLDDPDIPQNRITVRTHNIEHEYYRGLAQSEKNIFKKIYFQQEAAKLEAWEHVLAEAYGIATISPSDTEHFRQLNVNTVYIPAFHPFTKVNSETGKGAYALYHGNLSVAENHHAAMYLVENIFSKIAYPLVIAGNHPQKELQAAARKYPNITMKSNIPVTGMEQLIHEAQLHVLPTFQSTGIKLKLLYALYSGRHCLANPGMVAGTGLENCCTICTTDAQWIEAIKRLAETPFTEDEKERRKKALESWDTKANAEKLMTLTDMR